MEEGEKVRVFYVVLMDWLVCLKPQPRLRYNQ